MFEGFWIHGKTGVSHRVYDHAVDLASTPAKFGMTPHEVHAITGGEHFNQYDASANATRGKLIHAATLKGWVRVRKNRNQISVQLHGHAADKLKTVAASLAKTHSDGGSVFVSDFATGFEKHYRDGFHEIHKAIESGEIPNHAGTKQGIGADAQAELGKHSAVLGIPAGLPDHEVRALIRQGLHRRAGIPERKGKVAEADIPSVGAANLEGPDPMVQAATMRLTTAPPDDATRPRILTGDERVAAIRDQMRKNAEAPVKTDQVSPMPAVDNNPPEISTANPGAALQMPPGLR